MSATLAFSVDEEWMKTNARTDFSSVDAVALSTSVLSGDQYIQIDNVDMSVIGYQIALLEFARGLYLAVNSAMSALAFGQAHPLDAYEHRLTFRRNGTVIRIEADATGAVAQCESQELMAAIRKNYTDVINAMLSLHPEMRHSSVLYAWSSAGEIGVDHLFSDVARRGADESC